MPSVPGHSASAGVVIPLRAFTTGKARLAEVLDDRARSALATAMATTVVTAAGDLPIVIVSSAPEVQEWADTARLTVIEDPGSGLDHAVDVGRAHFRRLEVARVIVAHADLPRARPESLVRFALDEPHVVSIVPSHRDDGTPVISVPADAPFEFSYGVGSATRHAAIARGLGLVVQIVSDPDLAYDVDLPEDLLTS